MKLWKLPAALFLRRLLGRHGPPKAQGGGDARPPTEQIVAQGTPEGRAEIAVLALLGLAVLAGVGFIVVYAVYGPGVMPNELLGLALGCCALFIALALTVVAKFLVVTEEIEEDYPQEHPQAQAEVADIVRQSGSRLTRRRMLAGAGLAAGGTLATAALTPVLSIGPFWYTKPLDESPWRRGVRLVDETGAPIAAANVQQETFYTAFPEGADPEQLSAPLVVIRLDPARIRLPRGRHGWAPEGIMAYSKICTHAGCAIALYRKPKFAPIEPEPALVCPCHYSTFDPFTGGTVTYGPAGRPLPQLPLMIDGHGWLRAAGDYSGRVGPGWWNVREAPVSE
ncbi:MAG: ubiquinol-cytochrome c reductase iron-sulfur subunit [Solirubrobacteraceae bacterium]